MNIGLTGGIASGKSTVSKMLVHRGAILIDADQIAREVVEPGSPVLDQVAAHFGQAIITDDGRLDRKKLGSIIFHNEAERQALNHILHPPIRKMMKDRMTYHEEHNPHRLIVVDVPLLYESGLERMFEEVVVVYVPVHIQIQRLMDRDGLSREEAQRRIEAQMSIEIKKEKADDIIDNQGSKEETERQVQQFWQRKGLR